MIVERLFHHPTPGPGRYSEFQELLKEEIQRVSSPHLHAVHLYADDIGCSAPFAQDLEFDSLAQRDKFWEGYFADPEGRAFRKKYFGLIDRYNTSEIWNIVE